MTVNWLYFDGSKLWFLVLRRHRRWDFRKGIGEENMEWERERERGTPWNFKICVCACVWVYHYYPILYTGHIFILVPGDITILSFYIHLSSLSVYLKNSFSIYQPLNVLFWMSGRERNGVRLQSNYPFLIYVPSLSYQKILGIFSHFSPEAPTIRPPTLSQNLSL